MGLHNLLCYQVKTLLHYINTSEIPGELSRVNITCSHVKITRYCTREDDMLFSQV